MTEHRLANEVFDLFAARPSGLLSDIDGTLSRISLDPSSAKVDPVIKATLHRLRQHIDVLAVLTGRSAAEASSMVGLNSVVCLGNHGMERMQDGSVVVATAARDYVEPLRRVLNAAERRIEDPLVYFENKGVTGSIHYRNATNPAAARDLILQVVEPFVEQEGLRLSQGRMVIEIRPPVDLSKGTALQEIVDEYGLKSVLFMGDDVTDLDAMRVVTRLRSDGKVNGLSIGVVGPETPDAVRKESDHVVQGVDGVSEFLTRLADLYA